MKISQIDPGKLKFRLLSLPGQVGGGGGEDHRNSRFFGIVSRQHCNGIVIVVHCIVLILGGPFAELHCLGSGIQFELLGSGFFQIALNGNAH